MKSLHTIVLANLVVAMCITTILYVRSNTNNVMTYVGEASLENKKAINQRLKALEDTLLNSTDTATSATTDELGLRIQELNSATTSRIDNASSDTSAKFLRRLDSLEKTIDDKFASLIKDTGVAFLKTLEGEWEATLPSGVKRQGFIKQLNDVQYKLTRLGVFGGIYELKDNRLVVVEPDDNRLTEFVWKVQDANNLILIESPTATGSDYSGTSLKRIK